MKSWQSLYELTVEPTPQIRICAGTCLSPLEFWQTDHLGLSCARAYAVSQCCMKKGRYRQDSACKPCDSNRVTAVPRVCSPIDSQRGLQTSTVARAGEQARCLLHAFKNYVSGRHICLLYCIYTPPSHQGAPGGIPWFAHTSPFILTMIL